MATTTPAATVAAPETIDQRVTFHDVSWSDFELILAIRGDRAGIRMTYLDGELELMTPSLDHEGIKKVIARLLEMYALERDIPLNGFGSWTLKKAVRARAVEPDECYSVGIGRPARPAGSASARCGCGGRASSRSTRSSATATSGASRARSFPTSTLPSWPRSSTRKISPAPCAVTGTRCAGAGRSARSHRAA